MKKCMASLFLGMILCLMVCVWPAVCMAAAPGWELQTVPGSEYRVMVSSGFIQGTSKGGEEDAAAGLLLSVWEDGIHLGISNDGEGLITSDLENRRFTVNMITEDGTNQLMMCRTDAYGTLTITDSKGDQLLKELERDKGKTTVMIIDEALELPVYYFEIQNSMEFKNIYEELQKVWQQGVAWTNPQLHYQFYAGDISESTYEQLMGVIQKQSEESEQTEAEAPYIQPSLVM